MNVPSVPSPAASDKAPAKTSPQVLMAVFDCLGVQAASAAYVSTPITTGRALISWHAHGAVADRFEEEVVRFNSARARDLVRLTRQRFMGTVIDPTQLPSVADWNQPDYHVFWTAVLEKYVNTIVFVDDWQYSTGAVHEFASGIARGLTLLDSRFVVIDPETALAESGPAVSAFKYEGLDESALKRAWESAMQAWNDRSEKVGF